MVDLGSARRWAQELITKAIDEGAHVVDATMGNGHDTLWLCSLVGENGRVTAFDIQPEALSSTAARLAENGMTGRAELILGGHERMDEFVTDKVDAVLFNLGWLPGIEHAVTTKTETTITAVNKAVELLKPGGVVTICVYPGHPEGKKELQSLLDWAEKLDPARFDACVRSYLNIKNDPPVMIAVAARIPPKKKKTGV